MDTKESNLASKYWNETTDPTKKTKTVKIGKTKNARAPLVRNLARRPFTLGFVLMALILALCIINAASNASSNSKQASSVQLLKTGDFIVYKMTILLNDQQHESGLQTILIESVNESEIGVGIGYVDLPDRSPYHKTCEYNTTGGIFVCPGLFGGEYVSGKVVDQRILASPFGEKRMDDYQTYDGIQVDGFYPIGSGIPFNKSVIDIDGTTTIFEIQETNIEWLKNI